MSNEVIKRFIERVRHTARTQSKQVVLTMDEAQDLSNNVALLLLRENELLQEISELKNANEITEVVIGGGSFK